MLLRRGVALLARPLCSGRMLLRCPSGRQSSSVSGGGGVASDGWLPEDLRLELARAAESDKFQPEFAHLVRRLWRHLDGRRAHQADAAAGAKKKFVLMLPPPNVTGVLHMGHALAFVIQDVLVRWHRANGVPAVWLPGFDHAGIATQVLMEKRLAKQLGLSRRQIGRDRFLAEAAKWADEKRSEIRQQMQQLGLSVDWDQEFFTFDEKHSRVVTEAFVRLFNRGQIYRSQQLVNWSCALQSAISDIEVESREIPGPTRLPVPGHARPVEFGRLHRFLYPFADGDGGIVVATTRPETMLGDTAVAVHPDDARYSALIGRRLRHPLAAAGPDGSPRLLPVVGHASVDPNFGSGAVKLTPAHSRPDFVMAAEALPKSAPLLTVFTESGAIGADCGAPADLVGLPRFDARERLVQRLAELGLYRGAEEHAMTLPVCSRSGDIVEQQLKSQWFVRCTAADAGAASADSADSPAGRAAAAVQSGQLAILPAGYSGDWLEWMRRSADWCVSRQIWWGHQVPAYELLDGSNGGSSLGWLAARSDAEAAQLASERHPGRSVTLRRDPDVLDTWFSSGLLPLFLAGWPDRDPPDPERLPLSLLQTGHDILFFWAARMVMLTQLLLDGRLPFGTVLLNGLVCDSRGQKMSKSRGNVIDPIGLIGRAGPDALRLALCSHRFQLDRVAFDPQLVDVCARLVNKLWQAHRFLRPRLSEAGLLGRSDALGLLDEIEQSAEQLDKVDTWLLSRLAALTEDCDGSFAPDSFRLQEAANRLREFWIAEFCDIGLECLKSPAAGPASLRVACLASLIYLARLAPFCPHVCQLLWLSAHGSASTMSEDTSSLSATTLRRLSVWRDRGREDVAGFVLDLLAGFRDWRALLQPRDRADCVLLYSSAECPVDATLYGRMISQLGQTRLVHRSAAAAASAFNNDLLRLELCPGLHFAAPRESVRVDEATQQLRARLSKQGRRRDELLQQMRTEATGTSDGGVSPASAAGTEAQRKKLAALTDQIGQLTERLQQLEGISSRGR